jgi:uncharacterized membrane protein YgcG
MKLSGIMRYGLAALLTVSVVLVGSPRASAQGGPGGFQPTPEMRAKFAAWQKWREANKNLSNLQTMFIQVQQMDKDPQVQLTKPQAGKMLTILKTWRSKPTMSDDQAKQVSKAIGGMLTDKQLKKMSTIQPFGGMRRGGGGFGGGGGRPGGGGGGGRPGGGFTFPDPPKNGYNPLNPDTLPFERMRPMAKKAIDDFTADLQKRAKG